MKHIIITKFKNRFKKLFGYFYFTTWRIQGKIKNCETTATIYYFGKEVEKNYLRQYWFESDLQEENLGGKYFWQLSSFIKKIKFQCTLVIVECNTVLKIFLKKNDDFFIPQWLNGEINIPIELVNDSVYSDYRRIRNKQLYYTIADQKEDFDNFYYTMYEPYMSLRFDEQSLAISYKTFTNMILAQKCKLLIVKQNELILGAILIVFDENQLPFLWLLGIKNANLEYLKLGTIAALYFFSADYLEQLGYKKMFVGACRSFLGDGILKYKKKLGLHIVSHSFTGYLLKPCQYSDSFSALMLGFPFVTIENKKMHGIVFTNLNSENIDTVIQKAEKEYMIKGLEGIRYFHISPEQNKIELLNIKQAN